MNKEKNYYVKKVEAMKKEMQAIQQNNLQIEEVRKNFEAATE